MSENPTTQELRVAQLKRELEEKDRAEEAELKPETETHDRRAMNRLALFLEPLFSIQ